MRPEQPNQTDRQTVAVKSSGNIDPTQTSLKPGQFEKPVNERLQRRAKAYEDAERWDGMS